VTLLDDGDNVYTLDVITATIAPSAPAGAVIYAASYGVRADGRRVTDGSMTGGSTTLTSATANFTQADVGKSIILSRIPMSQAAGTLSGTSGTTTLTGTGVNFPVDMPITGGGTGTGIPETGAIYCPPHYLAIQYSTGSGNTLLTVLPLPATITNQPYYKEVQISTTITSYISATQVTIGVAATISASSISFFVATDDTAATDAAIRAAFATSHRVVFPTGLIGHSANLNFFNLHGVTIEGSGVPGGTCFVDLRKESVQYPYPMADENYAAFSFKQCSGVTIQNIAYDGSVCVFAINHTEGGVSNFGGGRGGFTFRSTPDVKLIGMGSQGYASRDEYLSFVDSPNCYIGGCNCPQTNNVTINFNGSAIGCRIVDNVLGGGILVTGDSYVIANNVITGAPGVGAGITVDCNGHGIVVNNTIHDAYSYGSGAIDVFGSPDAAATLLIAGNNIFNMTGQYYTGAGAIAVKGFPGHATIMGNTIKNCISLGAGGRNIHVSGASTGTVVVGPNTFGTSGTDMTVGIYIHTDVPAGAVTISPGSTFHSSITTKWTLGVEPTAPVDLMYQLQERADPPAPAANLARVYAKDNGAGKTQLVVRFPTGAVQVIATEP
jgi:hypothetical protein